VARRVFVSGQITRNNSITAANSINILPAGQRQQLQAASSLAPTIHRGSSSSASVAAAENDDRPAPLFLRHVVYRHFDYLAFLLLLLDIVTSKW